MGGSWPKFPVSLLGLCGPTEENTLLYPLSWGPPVSATSQEMSGASPPTPKTCFFIIFHRNIMIPTHPDTSRMIFKKSIFKKSIFEKNRFFEILKKKL